VNCRLPFLSLVLVCLIAHGFSQTSAPPYPNSNDGLTKLLEVVLASAKSGDDSAMAGFVHEMDIPNYDAWFRTNYSPDKAEKYSAQYGREKEKNDSSLQQALERFAKSEGIVSVVKLDSNSLKEGNPAWEFYHAQTGPLDLYRALFIAVPEGRRGMIGYFTFIDGKFRWLSLIGASAEGVFRVGGGVSAPRALVSPDPGYTKEAQKAKLQGR
jgi:hypothetical protein